MVGKFELGKRTQSERVGARSGISGNKVRVNAQLIDARNDRHEWAENYDWPIDDVFAIQSEIAKAIADQLRSRLPPTDIAALAVVDV